MNKAIVIYLIASMAFFKQVDAQVDVDSLVSVWQDEAAPDSSRLVAVGQIVQFGYLFSRPDTAFEIAQEMYEFADEQGFPKWMERARNYQGISHAIRGNHQEAITNFSECLSINELEGNKHRIAGSLNNIGLLYQEIDDYEESIKYLDKALVLYEAITDTNGMALTMGNISMQYNRLGEFEKSIPLGEKSLEFFRKTKDKKGTANALSSLGASKGSLGDAARDAGDLEKARVFYQAALDYYREALPMREQIGDKDGVAVTLHGMGMIYEQLGDKTKAIDYISRSLVLSEEVQSLSNIRNAAGELSKLYKSKGQFERAMGMYELYHSTNDSILSQENQRAVIRQEFDYAYEKQLLADSLRQAEITYAQSLSHQQELRKKDRNRNILLTFGLLFVILALGLWSRVRFIRSSNIELAAAKERAEQSEKYKEQFLANMSHEIRTPMHAISGMVKILKRNEHLQSQQTFLDAIHSSSDNLVVILNDVLDLSKIEAGKLDIEHIPLNPRDVLENVTQILKFKAEEKGLNLSYRIDDDIPSLIMGDPTRLNQILINLVGNAIKFTEKGGVDIVLQAKNELMQIRINDSGIGIPKEKIKDIFGAFEQAQESTSRQYGGTGLGLSISKQLVELQKGRIWVESEEGKGSTFFVELPLLVAADDIKSENVVTKERLSAMTSALQGSRILLAEDNPFNQMIAQDDLTFYINDLKIDIVENGALAVEKFQQEDYDLVLMDVQMPEMGGFEATEKIRAIEKGNGGKVRVPIIAMTASLLKSEIERCYEAGMDNYVPKPYKIEDLIVPIYKELNP